MRDIPLFIVIVMPLAILGIELTVYLLAETWKWFIGNNEK